MTLADPPEVVAEAAERVPEPEVIVKVIVSPSAMRFPWASFTRARISLVLAPSAGRVLGVAVTVMLATTVPLKVTVTVCVTPFEVAVTVADPAAVPAINETDTIPVSSTVVTLVLDKVPRVVEKVTVVPTGTGFPVVSLTVAVITLELEPSAGMLVGDAVRAMDPTPALVRVMVVLPDTELADMA